MEKNKQHKTILELQRENKKLKQRLELYKSQLDERIDARSKELQESEARYRMVIEEAADGIAIINAKGIIMELNKGLASLVQKSLASIEGNHVSTLFPPEELEAKPLRHDMVNKGIGVINVRNLLRENGTSLLVETSTNKLHDGRIIMFFRNLDIRKEFMEAKELSNDLVNNIRVGIYIYQLVNKNDEHDLVLIRANPASEKATGLPANELIGKSITQIFPNLESRGVVDKYIDTCKKKSSLDLGEFAYQDDRLKKAYYDVKAFSLPGDKLGVSFEEVTARKINEEKLREAEKRYRYLFINSQIGLFRTKVDGSGFVEVNDTFARIFGYKNRADFFKANMQVWNIYTNEEDRKKMLKTLLKTGEIRNFEVQFKKKDNTPVWVRYSGKLDVENEWLDGVLEDITTEKQAADKLKRSEQKFRNIYNSSSDAMVIFHPRTLDILDANQAFLERVGINLEKARELKILDILVKDYIPEIQQRLTKIVQGHDLPALEIEVHVKNLETLPVEISSKVIEYDHQKVILSIARDISERKLLEQKLADTLIETEENERMRLAQDLHDEIGPLMSTLNMYVSALTTLKTNEKRDEFIQNIQQLVQETNTRIREVSNTLSPHVLNQFGLCAAINSVIEQVSEFVQIHFETSLDNARFSSKVELAYYRIIRELINNTMKHANARNIHIRLSYNAPLLILVFEDDGIGFDFEKETSDLEKGMGLYNIMNRARSIKAKYNFENMKGKGMHFQLFTHANQTK